MRVSVITPVYNAEHYIANIVSDLHEQTEKSAEFIIVNDGSKDETLIQLKSILAKFNDSRFVIYDKKNSGVSDTRNFGLSKANGDYIFFADCDDRLRPNLLKRYCDSIELHDSDIEFFPFFRGEYHEGTLKIVEKFLNYGVVASNKLLSKDDILSLIFAFKIQGYPFGYISKRSFWQPDPFSKELSLGEDLLALLSTLAEKEKVVSYVNRQGDYIYIDRNDSALNTVSTKQIDALTFELSKLVTEEIPDYLKPKAKNLIFGLFVDAYQLSKINHSKEGKRKYFKLMCKNFMRTSMPVKSRIKRFFLLVL